VGFTLPNHSQRLLEWAPRIFFGFAIVLQLQTGFATLPGDLIQADPPTHFTTGVMLHDFLRSGQPLRPFPFAECFYVHYPKVAFGHWPPVFYILEALWFFVFGAKIVAARWLCACITAVCAVALYRRCRIDWGQWSALSVTALFLALPPIRQQTWLVMSDLLVAGFMFLALCSLSDYLNTARISNALWLALWSSLAILTKGTGWLLLGPIAAAPLLTGRFRMYRSRGYWLAVALTCAASAPFYLWMNRLNLGYPVGFEWQLHRLRMLLPVLLALKWLAVAIVLIAILALALYRFLPRKPLQRTQTTVAVFLVWGLVLAAFITLFPLTPELLRYFIPAIAPAAYLLAAAIVIIPYGKPLACVVCAGLLAAFVPLPVNSTTAYSQAVGTIPRAPGHIILVESDSGGEGALIAAHLQRDPQRSTYMLRGTKFLEISDWSGAHFTPKYSTAAAVRAALESVGPDYIVVDTSAPPTSDARLLMEVVQGSADRWNPIARIPVKLSFRSGELLVYRREPPSGRPGAPPSVQLGPERGLQTFSCKTWQD
jgi:hypothetical protein